MSWIPPAQILLHLFVGIGPEGGEVGGDLHGAVIGGEDFERDREGAAEDAEFFRVGVVKFLHLGGDDALAVGSVAQHGGAFLIRQNKFHRGQRIERE